jgi:hypothetical protein
VSREADCRDLDQRLKEGSLKVWVVGAFRHGSLVAEHSCLALNVAWPLMIPEPGRVFRFGIFRARRFRTISLVGLPETDILSHQWQKFCLWDC